MSTLLRKFTIFFWEKFHEDLGSFFIDALRSAARLPVILSKRGYSPRASKDL